MLKKVVHIVTTGLQRVNSDGNRSNDLTPKVDDGSVQCELSDSLDHFSTTVTQCGTVTTRLYCLGFKWGRHLPAIKQNMVEWGERSGLLTLAKNHVLYGRGGGRGQTRHYMKERCSLVAFVSQTVSHPF
jgi:hypothetical protein